MHSLRRHVAGRGMRARSFWPALVALLVAFVVPAWGYDPGKVAFDVLFKEEICPYRVMAMCVLPGEAVRIGVLSDQPQEQFELRSTGGRVRPVRGGGWEWRAPGETGLFPLEVVHRPSGEAVTLQAFVQVPAKQVRGGYLNGYRIGKYPRLPHDGLTVYAPPKGFIEVTPANENVLVAPHFQLKDFLCRQEGGYPKYLVLQERLLVKLELIMEELNAAGYVCERLAIMSGYRTPYYNRLLGNVDRSRHLWGGAADIYVDNEPADGTMDDLNGDGEVSRADADLLCDLIEGLSQETFYAGFFGGLAPYRETDTHGPFVHVDVRGFRARWGH